MGDGVFFVSRGRFAKACTEAQYAAATLTMVRAPKPRMTATIRAIFRVSSLELNTRLRNNTCGKLRTIQSTERLAAGEAAQNYGASRRSVMSELKLRPPKNRAMNFELMALVGPVGRVGQFGQIAVRDAAQLGANDVRGKAGAK
jgi:hypothetical protein